MITPTDIRTKAQKLWDSGRILQDAWENSDLFPWEIPFRKPNASAQMEQCVDSKFIGQHKAILGELLDVVLPETALDPDSTGLRQYGFERRYGLKYDEPLLRLRLLDNALSPVTGMTDVSLPVSQLAQWDIPCQRVFVTENKTNGLSFPPIAHSIVIFGLGYGVDTLAEIPWLQTQHIVYWGDLDTHGFSILSRMRRYFPHTQSLLMDAQTLQQYAHLCVEEPENARCTDILQYLQPQEAAMYQHLQQTHQRLEQERLPMAYVQQQLAAIQR